MFISYFMKAKGLKIRLVIEENSPISSTYLIDFNKKGSDQKQWLVIHNGHLFKKYCIMTTEQFVLIMRDEIDFIF